MRRKRINKCKQESREREREWWGKRWRKEEKRRKIDGREGKKKAKDIGMIKKKMEKEKKIIEKVRIRKRKDNRNE